MRAAALVRDGYRCVRCGRLAAEVHHRIGRGKGGNLLDRLGAIFHLTTLHGPGNTGGCHGWAHSDPAAREQGYTITGEVRLSGPGGRPVYVGPDERFRAELEEWLDGR